MKSVQLRRLPNAGLITITLLAGLLYSSWPLGYWLNPSVNKGLASDLEAAHQPYSWVFIGLDIISGLLICTASWWLLKLVARARLPLIRYSVLGFGAFGLLTAIDALLPIDCVSVLKRCGSSLKDPNVVTHGIISIGSILGLTVSILAMWWLVTQNRQSPRRLRWLLHGTVAVWVGFGIVTLILIIESRSSALSQHIFITVCSLWTAGLPYLTLQVIRIQEQTTENL